MWLNDNYRVISKKQGGMGDVYICADKNNGNEQVALKTYREDLETDSVRDLFIREVKAWIRLGKGEFILCPEKIELINNKPFIVLPYCKNGNLRNLLQERQYSIEEATLLITQLALGMYRVGDVDGLVHQDLKPENILLGDDNRPLISDLGIVKALCNGKALKDSLVRIDNIDMKMGTLPYMSPEQLKGEEVDARSDIYALGLIFYEILSGERAMYGGTQEELMLCISKGMSERLNGIRTTYGENYSELIRKCTEINRDKRPSNFKELIYIIDNFINPEPYGKKQEYSNSEVRVKITDERTVFMWGSLFPERVKESGRYHSSIKYKEIRMAAQGEQLLKIGETLEALDIFKKLLGSVRDTNSKINALLLAFSSPDTKYKTFDVNTESLNMDISGGIGLYLIALERCLMAYVDLIESSVNDISRASAYINESISVVDKIITCAYAPTNILILCTQLKIKNEEYVVAEELLYIIIKNGDDVQKRRAYAALIIVLQRLNAYEKLETLVRGVFVDELFEDETYLSQKVCAKGFEAIHKYKLAAHCYYNAYQANRDDLTALTNAGVHFVNANDMDNAIAVCQELEEVAPNSKYYKYVFDTINSDAT